MRIVVHMCFFFVDHEAATRSVGRSPPRGGAIGPADRTAAKRKTTGGAHQVAVENAAEAVMARVAEGMKI